jgi:hypothetical protein
MVKRNLDVREKKEQLHSELRDVRSAILVEAARISPDLYGQVFLGSWCLKDLLAHLAGWDVTNLAAAREILEDKLPSFNAHYDKDWVSYNTALVQEHRREDPEELIAHIKAMHQSLLVYLEELPAEEFYRDRGIRAGRYKVTIGHLLEAERDDERKHLGQIQAFRKSVEKY